MNVIDFYFDFTSPYAYLAHYRLKMLADKYSYEIAYKPIDLKAAKLAAGNTGPANIQLPVKLRYIMADLMRWVQRYSVPFKVGKEASFESAQANKGTFFAIEKGQVRDYVSKLWLATYGSGGSMGSEDLLRDVAKEMGWSSKVFFDFLKSAEVENLYEQANTEAHSRGVFGVPIMIVRDEMWWGNDRLDFLEEYIAS